MYQFQFNCSINLKKHLFTRHFKIFKAHYVGLIYIKAKVLCVPLGGYNNQSSIYMFQKIFKGIMPLIDKDLIGWNLKLNDIRHQRKRRSNFRNSRGVRTDIFAKYSDSVKAKKGPYTIIIIRFIKSDRTLVECKGHSLQE